MERPNITYAEIELHLAPSPDFSKRFAAKVRAVGGRFTEIRGDANTRYVTLPASEPDLIDALGKAYPKARKTTAITKLHSVDGNRRVEHLLSAARTVFHWDQTTSPSLSEFVRKTFDARLDNPASFDWPAITSRWAQDDARSAALKREVALRGEFEELKADIAAEALRLLDGANDISDLKDLAARLRAVCTEAGIDEPQPRHAQEDGTAQALRLPTR